MRERLREAVPMNVSFFELVDFEMLRTCESDTSVTTSDHFFDQTFV